VEQAMDVQFAFSLCLAVIAYSGLFGTILLIVILLKKRLLTEVSFIIMFSLAISDTGKLAMMAFHSLPEQILGIEWPDWDEHVANASTLFFWYVASIPVTLVGGQLHAGVKCHSI
jgi:hypothetical protein